jgi:hypothetical protein
VAFAWDISEALGEPVAAIVPGYGLADVIPLAVGGWYGFEMYNLLQMGTQHVLANVAPDSLGICVMTIFSRSILVARRFFC